MCCCGADDTRDELRKQVYDAMAEKTEEVDGKSSAQVKGEGGVAASPVKHAVNGSVNHPVNGEESTPVNGVEKSPSAVNGVSHSPPGKDVLKDENGQEDADPEGSL